MGSTLCSRGRGHRRRRSGRLPGRLARSARRTTDGDSLVLAGTPEVDLSGARAKLPPGAFLQASHDAEGSAGRSWDQADLFEGRHLHPCPDRVAAYEADEAVLVALAEAVRRTPKLKPIKTVARDLFRSPLGLKELQGFDAVVFDPPRAGAAAQAEALSKSRVRTLVAVSCNPGTLARDLRILVDGGYRIAHIVPVDQFLFSPHIEVVAHLVR